MRWNFSKPFSGAPVLNKKLIVVLGMHRSGTSLITRSLKVLGVELGDHLLGSHPDNVKGFWEDIDIKELNQKMLESLGRTWHTVTWLDSQLITRQLQNYRLEAKTLLNKKIANVNYFGLKDPRLCLLLPFWQPIFEVLGLDVKYIFIFRHPLSVAESLVKRNDIFLDKALYLWLLYNLSALSAVRKKNVLFINYDEFLQSPRNSLDVMNKYIGTSCFDEQDFSAFSSDYIDSSMRHHHHEVNDLSGQQSTLLRYALGFYKKISSHTSASNKYKLARSLHQELKWQTKYLASNQVFLESIERSDLEIKQIKEQLLKRELDLLEKSDFEISALKEQVITLEKRLSDLNIEYSRKIRFLEGESLYEYHELREVLGDKVAYYEAIKASELFDRKFYLESNPDVAAADTDPLVHYLLFGDTEGRNPNALFDTTWYKNQYAASFDEVTNSLFDYVTSGWVKGRQPHPLFNTEWYLSQNADVALSGKEPLSHYIEIGWREGRQPNFLFDGKWYLDQYHSALKDTNPLVHYTHLGWLSNLEPHVLFDSEWYWQQYQEEEHGSKSALQHYLEIGQYLDKSPHPLFDPVYYRKRYLLDKSELMPLRHFLSLNREALNNPHFLFDSHFYKDQDKLLEGGSVDLLKHYLSCGALEQRNPHYIFNAKFYTARYMQAGNEKNPLIHYLKIGVDRGYIFNYFINPSYFNTNSSLELTKKLADQYVDSFKPEKVSLLAEDSVSTSFDWLKQELALKRIQARRFTWSTLDKLPLVSIIMPTYNRKHTIAQAVESIIKQTCPHWELLIVDDGSTDGTLEWLKDQFDDLRIRYITQAHLGVSPARNTGLAQALGDYLAYLDTDNVWKSSFLEVMLTYAITEKADFLYAGIELIRDEGTFYRFAPFDFQQLKIRNYIDLNIFIHSRNLLEQSGNFDVALPRMVDWDFIIRCANFAEHIKAIPIIGAIYDDRRQVSRITYSQSSQWFYFILNKYNVNLDKDREKKNHYETIVIVPLLNTSLEIIQECIHLLLSYHEKARPYQIILVHDNSSQAIINFCHLLALTWENVTILSEAFLSNFSLAYNFALKTIQSNYVFFLKPTTLVPKDWLVPLMRALKQQNNIIVQPLFLNPNGRIEHAGLIVDAIDEVSDAVRLAPALQGFARDHPIVQSSFPIANLGDGCIGFAYSELLSDVSFNPVYLEHLEFFEFGLSLATGVTCHCIPESQIILYSDERSHPLYYGEKKKQAFVVQYDFSHLEELSRAWLGKQGLYIQAYLPSLLQQSFCVMKERPSFDDDPVPVKPSYYFVIKIACPSIHERKTWGDYYYAEAFGQALTVLGHHYKIEYLQDWINAGESVIDPNSKTSQVNLVLRGLQPVPLNTTGLNLMWLISHPELVTVDEMRAYDHVFIASEYYAHCLQQEPFNLKSASCLLQCTDPDIFYPVYTLLPKQEITFVGNSRNVYRESVRLAYELGYLTSVYGTLWEQYLPKALIKQQYLPNQELGECYRQSLIVLNDHWQDMASQGFVSNRVFDVLATCSYLISDKLKHWPAHLEQMLVSYDNVESFQQAIGKGMYCTPLERQQQWQNALSVMSQHSFLPRARAVLRKVEELIAAR